MTEERVQAFMVKIRFEANKKMCGKDIEDILFLALSDMGDNGFIDAEALSWVIER